MSPGKAPLRWLAAVAVSLVLHAAAVSTLSGQVRPAPPPPGKLTVALRRVEPPGDGKQAGGTAAAQPEAAPVAPKPPAEQKPPVAPKPQAEPRKPAAKPRVAPKPIKPSETRSGASVVPKTPQVSPTPVEGRMTGNSTPALSKGEKSGGVVDVADLKVLRRVKPDYPAIARRRREEGTVTLLLTLEGDGVADVKVEKSSGFSTLDEAAVAAVRRWRFENAGKTLARVPVTFRLNGQ